MTEIDESALEMSTRRFVLDFSQFGSYNISLIAAAAMGALSCLGCLFIPSTRDPERATGTKVLAY